MAVFRSANEPVDERRRKRVAALSLIGLSAFLAAQALMVRSYGSLQKRPPSWDQAIHMEIALDYQEAYKAGRWSSIMDLAPKPGMPPFPPLYHLALMHTYGSSDPAAAALWVNWCYLALLCFSLFFICFAFRPDWAALGAVIAFAASPGIQELLFTQLIDLPVVALVAAAYLAFLYSDDFKSWVPSLLLGAIFGIGMLHKWTFFSYLIPAYLSGMYALSNNKSRTKVLACTLIAAAICAPWYYRHIAMLVPRLFQASSDFAVPVTQGWAFLLYFLVSADSLGPLFWALGWVGLGIPSYRERSEKSWIVWAWVLTSYIFWAIVPNRQMRFLLPGFSALAVGMCGSWPTGLIWALAGFQLFGAVNYSNGWIAGIQIPLPLHDITLLPSNAPAAEDWHIEDVLRAAQGLSDPAKPVANLTVVANAPYFNATSFGWLARVLKLPTVHVRGVNKRICEFSQFVVLKDDKLGPAGVIEGLPEAARIINAPNGWFSRGYEKAGLWPLPDGSNAILYKQRQLSGPPIAGKGTQFTYYTSGPLTADDLKIELAPWDKTAADYPLIKVGASSIELRGVKVAHPALELENAVIMPAAEDKKAPEWDDVRFLKISRLRLLSAELDGADLKAYLEERVKGLHLDTLKLDKTVSVSGQISHLSFAAEFSVDLLDSPRRLKVTVLQARFGASAVPSGLLGAYREFTYPLTPSPETPFDIDLPSLTIKDGKLTIP